MRGLMRLVFTEGVQRDHIITLMVGLDRSDSFFFVPVRIGNQRRFRLHGCIVFSEVLKNLKLKSEIDRWVGEACNGTKRNLHSLVNVIEAERNCKPFVADV